MNKVILSGRLGRDPEQITKGVTFSIATNDWDGTQEITNWHRILVFGKEAETASRFLKKGSKLLLEGKMISKKNERHGNVVQTSIIATKLYFMDSIGQKTDSGITKSQEESLVADLLDNEWIS